MMERKKEKSVSIFFRISGAVISFGGLGLGLGVRLELGIRKNSVIPKTVQMDLVVYNLLNTAARTLGLHRRQVCLFTLSTSMAPSTDHLAAT